MAKTDSVETKVGKAIFYVTCAVSFWFFYWFAGIQCPCWFWNWLVYKGGVGMQKIVYVIISLVISVGYFQFLDWFLMDQQGLDYFYILR